MADKNFKVKNGLDIGDNITIADDSSIIGLDTDDLNEGMTNIYYTEARVDANFATKTTDALTEGTTNKYYASSLFDADLATKDTGDLAEGTNLYYTTARANSDFDTRLATKSTSDVAEGTNLYYTDGRFDTRLATKSTSDLAEGTNLYHTDTRARSAVVGDQSELGLDGTTVYVKSVRNETRVKGSLEMTRDDDYVFPPLTNNWVVGNNGFDMASSNDGWLPSASTSLFLRDSFAYTSSGTSFNMRTADGTSTTTGTNPWFGTPNTGPLQTPAGSLMGTINWNGYATGSAGEDWTNNFSTNSMGGGIRVSHALQLQGYLTEAPTTGTVSVVPTSQGSRFNATITGTSILTTKGVISYTGTAPGVGQIIRIFGAPTGTGSIVGYTSGKQYYCVARDTTALTFTISETANGLPVTTVPGTTTGMTLQRCGVFLNHASTDPIPFYNGSIVSVSGVTGLANGLYTVFSSTATSVGIGAYTTTNLTFNGSSLVSADTITAGGAGLRVRAFPNSTIWNLNTRKDMITHELAGATYLQDSFTFKDSTGADMKSGKFIYRRTHGCFHKVAAVTAAASNTVYNFDWTSNTTTHHASGITISNTSHIDFDDTNTYNVQVQFQARNTSNALVEAWIWVAKNGTDIAETGTQISLRPKGSASFSYQQINTEWLLDVTAGDYLEIRFAVSDHTAVSIEYTAANTLGFTHASIPSGVLTIQPSGA